jgi:hypothetical protein
MLLGRQPLCQRARADLDNLVYYFTSNVPARRLPRNLGAFLTAIFQLRNAPSSELNQQGEIRAAGAAINSRCARIFHGDAER